MEEHRNESKKSGGRKGYRVVFLLAFSMGLSAELLLFIRAQMNQIAFILKDDFRIVAVKSERGKVTASEVENGLKNIQGTLSAVFVDKEARLKKLKEDDPELVSSVLAVGGNPLPDTWEIKLKEDALGGVDLWTEEARKVPGVADIRYKPLEAYAILHALFYAQLITLGFYAAACAFLLMSVMILSYRKTLSGLFCALKKDSVWFAAGAAGAGLSTIAAYGLIYPVKYLSSLWVWPNPLWHAAIAAVSALGGWVLCQWKNER
ncbi:MAG: hypothetical protein A2X34_06435 [Elusimicrobia bacterium GWC2_51_8]|nr:MAG: hypothetical protein A2X33_08260 [Elusimicrobia bacterium GWA2_51_34]OGR61257.1 MAG: hypothetical protein A2X34_06435 [Elusimicrobia bacterium GWC2_51_8]OGR86012.1 MAG: hypothetical protein A2021_05340 [Elusimicrobia bacterium GWF2_52_66]HAF94497.1 hypothetical protein [Elusimicrobiota bacterium]HCE98944.1 hypothetical protein [Elusimicrobiota bacterium]